MIKLVAINKRKKGLTHREYVDYWLNRHAPLARRLPKLRGYVINEITGEMEGGESEFDGFAELWWDTEEDLRKAFRSDVGKQADKDLGNFVGFGVLLLVKEHKIV